MTITLSEQRVDKWQESERKRWEYFMCPFAIIPLNSWDKMKWGTNMYAYTRQR